MKEKFGQQPETPKQNAPEAGVGPLGKPPPDQKQQPQREGIKSPERQPLPGAWDVLERKVRLRAPDIEERPRLGSQEYRSEADELNRLDRELREKGTARDRLILDLYGEIRFEPAPFPNPVDLRNLSLAEFQQFRSKIEPMSDDEIAEEFRKQEEENDQKSDEFFRNEGGGFPPPNPNIIV